MSHSTVEFNSLGLSAASLRILEKVGYARPTPIQARALPPGLAGKDVIGCAATGTGKTAVFVLTIAERLTPKAKGALALILAPTRELAVQIADHTWKFCGPRGFRVATLIGGTGMKNQVEALKSAQLIVATPGRLIDHLDQGTARLGEIEILVLDEADRMLDMGFKPQLRRILAKVPRKRQTLLFSATMAGEVADFAKANLQHPVRVAVTPSGTTAEKATQCVYLVPQADKTSLLLSLLWQGDETTLVFTRTKRRADKLAKALKHAGLRTDRIHADRSQGQRKRAMEDFRRGQLRVLVATDIAARGIDVAHIGHVVNFDLPHQPEDYVHRVGRTARASASGHASSFAAPEELPLLRDIEKLIREPVPRAEVPREAETFLRAVAAEAARRADPGRQPGHGVSGRPPGQSPGRHARTHPKKRASAPAPAKPHRA